MTLMWTNTKERNMPEERDPTPRRTTPREDREQAKGWVARADAESDPVKRAHYLDLAARLDTSLRVKIGTFTPHVTFLIEIPIPWASMLDDKSDDDYIRMSKEVLLDHIEYPNVNIVQARVARTPGKVTLRKGGLND
jgi:hypothetical protein